MLQNKTLVKTIRRCAVKRLTTHCGFGTAADAIKTGDTFLLDLASTRSVELMTANGLKFQTDIVNVVDENGRVSGWMYAELFFETDLRFLTRFNEGK